MSSDYKELMWSICAGDNDIFSSNIVKQNFYWGLKITSKRAILNVEKCQRLHGCGEWRHWDVEKSGH